MRVEANLHAMVANYKYLLMANLVPYFLTDADHYVFWFTGNISMEQAEMIAYTCFPSRDIVVSVDAPDKQTISDIKYYHIFVCHTRN